MVDEPVIEHGVWALYGIRTVCRFDWRDGAFV